MSLIPKSNVWKNTRGYDEVSANTFNLVFALTTVFGWIAFAVAVNMFIHTKMSGMEYIMYTVIALAGCFVAAAESVGFKIVGMTMIAGGLGAVCGPYIGLFKMASVLDILFATVVITLVLGAAGWCYPKSLASWGSALFVSLIALIIVQLFLPLIYYACGLPLKGLTHLLDWIGILLFSAYLVFDFNRAQEVTKTLDNAISCGISVFLDMVNIFIRLLELFGVKTDD
jgi:FtsH-binding integral membrane protein